VPLAFRPDVLPTPLLPLVDPAMQQFLRRPTVAPEAREDGGSAPASTAAPADATDKPARRPASRDAAPQARDALPAETGINAPAGPEATLEPVGDQSRAIPARHAAALKGEGEQRAAPNAGEIRMTGVVASVGGVAVIARATGLIAKLLASSPASRGIPPTAHAGRKGAGRKSAAATRARRRLVKSTRPRRKSKR
jgi:hypothetical protein